MMGAWLGLLLLMAHGSLPSEVIPSGIQFLPPKEDLDLTLRLQDFRENQPQISDPSTINLSETHWVSFFDLWLIENPNSSIKLGSERKNDVDLAGKFQIHVCPGNAKILDKIFQQAKQRFNSVLASDLKDWEVTKRKGRLDLFPIWKGKVSAHWAEYRRSLSAAFAKEGLTCSTSPDSVGIRPSLSSLERVRLPARRWMGGLSIRAEVELFGKRLSGSFLIDSEAPLSLIDPSWLSRQGINPDLLRAVSTQSQTTKWAGGSGLGVGVEVEKLFVSNYLLPWKKFHFASLREKIGPPDSPSHCCDGVLGRDFLAQAVIELGGSYPTVVYLYPSLKDFNAPKNWMGIPIRWDSISQKFESEGEWRPLGDKTESKAGKVFWNLNIPDRIKWGTSKIKSYFLAELSFAKGAKIQAIEAPTGLPSIAQTTFGTSFLFEAGVIWDLPHGKIWLPEKLPEVRDEDWKTTRSGLEVQFLMRPKGRVLQVKSIKEGSPASEWKALGLEVGSTISKMNEAQVSDLDFWEAKRILDGLDGKTIRMEWQTRNLFTRIETFQFEKN